MDKVDWTLSFEPNEAAELKCKKLRYNCAVWNFDGDAKFYVSGPNGVGSSLLKQNYDWVKANFESIRSKGDPALNDTWFERSQITKEFLCPVKRLDTVLGELKMSLGKHVPFHFLKSDTQSGEFYVLDGAREYLERDCVGLELELYRYPLYEKLITEDEMKRQLDEMGFYVAGWTGYLNSFASQADFLFLRRQPRSEEERQAIEVIRSIYKPHGPQKLIKQPSRISSFIHKIKSKLSAVRT